MVYPVRRDLPILLAILLLATFLRLNGLNESGLWQDETIYSIAAQKPIIDQITNPIKTLRQDSMGAADPVLSAIPFSIALKLGFSNYLARFPAALFGILSVAMLYRLGRALRGNLVGLIAAFLLCTSSFHLLYSQEARSYSQLTFFTIASFWFLYRAITNNKLTNWLLYTFFSGAGISSHYDMAFVIFVQGIFLALLLPQQLLKRSYTYSTNKILLKSYGFFLLCMAIIFLFRLPWLNDFLYWSARTLGGPYSLDLIDNSVYSLRRLITPSVGIMAFYLFLCLVGLGFTLSRSFKSGVLLATWFGLSIPVTVFGLWFVSQFFHERQVIWGLPGILLATATGIANLSYFIIKNRFLPAFWFSWSLHQFVVVGLLITPLLFVNLQQIPQEAKDKQVWPLARLQEATSFIATHAQPNETLIGIPNAQYLQFYIQPVRPDLYYLDSRQTSLPSALKGRWYVFYGAEHIPKHWTQQVQLNQFNDILLVYRPHPCEIEDCLDDTNTLLIEMAQANPNSALTEKIQQIISGLTAISR